MDRVAILKMSNMMQKKVVMIMRIAKSRKTEQLMLPKHHRNNLEV